MYVVVSLEWPLEKLQFLQLVRLILGRSED